MTSVCQYLLCILYLFGFATSFNIDPDDVHDEEIDIRPLGKQLTEEKELAGYKCVFTYKAEGGTDETWKMILEVDESKQNFVCTVKRPDRSSYLFFENFQMEIIGGEVKKGTLKLPGDDPLPEDQYKIEGNTVKNVVGKFKSQLNEVGLWATRKSTKSREDL